MTDKPLASKFWDRWLKANELERLKIIEELPIFKGKHAIETTIASTLINSYLVDLAEHLTTYLITGKKPDIPTYCSLCHRLNGEHDEGCPNK